MAERVNLPTNVRLPRRFLEDMVKQYGKGIVDYFEERDFIQYQIFKKTGGSQPLPTASQSFVSSAQSQLNDIINRIGTNDPLTWDETGFTWDSTQLSFDMTESNPNDLPVAEDGKDGGDGDDGNNGEGVPIGGTAGQVLSKIDSTNFNTEWATPGASSSLNQIRMVYVSKAGDDSSSGLNTNAPMLTISAAITAAIAFTPTSTAQIAINILDGATYTESFTVPSFVNLTGLSAANDGSITLEDSSIVRLRRVLKSSVGGSVVKKDTGTGLSLLQVDLVIVSDSSQNGVRSNSGEIFVKAGALVIDGGIGIKAKNGSAIAFEIGEVSLSNGGIGIGTQVAGGSPNTFIGKLLHAVDDGTGVLLRTKVDGDSINIEGGVLEVDTLFDLGLNTTLNAFTEIATGTRTADASATVNVITLSGDSSLGGSLNVEALTIAGESIAPYSFNRLIGATTQAVTSTLTAITWSASNDSSGSDVTFSGANPTRLTAVSAGTYKVGGYVTIQSAGQRAQTAIEIMINGVATGFQRSGTYLRNSGTAYDFWTMELSGTPFTLSASDFVELAVGQVTGATYGYGGALTITCDRTVSEFWLERVA